MKGFLLLIPFFLIRFGLLTLLNKDAVKRAAYFAPLAGKEITAYWVYQISNLAIFIYICFLTVRIRFFWIFCAGLFFYATGLILCAVSIVNFAKPSDDGLNCNGLYRFSRNPMYVSYFIYFRRVCITDAVALVIRDCNHISNFFTLDYSFRREMVHRNIWGGIQTVHEKS